MWKEIAGIGAYPEGHGILGELISHPEPLRLAKLSEHPSSLAERAGQLGGRMEWHCPQGGGTTLVWRVPVAPP